LCLELGRWVARARHIIFHPALIEIAKLNKIETCAKSGFFVSLINTREAKKVSVMLGQRDSDKNSFESKLQMYSMYQLMQCYGITKDRKFMSHAMNQLSII
jgi:hypothetical protein